MCEAIRYINNFHINSKQQAIYVHIMREYGNKLKEIASIHEKINIYTSKDHGTMIPQLP